MGTISLRIEAGKLATFELLQTADDLKNVELLGGDLSELQKAYNKLVETKIQSGCTIVSKNFKATFTKLEGVNVENFKRWRDTFSTHFKANSTAKRLECSVETELARLMELFLRDKFNRDTLVIKATCKDLKVRNTNKAIQQYLYAAVSV